MKMNPKVLACLVLLLAAGCKVGPDFTPPKPALPAGWTGAPGAPQPSAVTTQPAELRQWWQQFGDPVLTSLIEEALRANLSLASAQANLRQARALRGIAAGGLWPSATASASAERQGGRAYVTGGGPANLFQAGLDASWELDIFGGARAGFAISMLVASYGAAQALISPVIGVVVDGHGYGPVCGAAAVLPLAAYAVLKGTRVEGQADGVIE